MIKHGRKRVDKKKKTFNIGLILVFYIFFMAIVNVTPDGYNQCDFSDTPPLPENVAKLGNAMTPAEIAKFNEKKAEYQACSREGIIETISKNSSMDKINKS